MNKIDTFIGDLEEAIAKLGNVLGGLKEMKEDRRGGRKGSRKAAWPPPQKSRRRVARPLRRTRRGLPVFPCNLTVTSFMDTSGTGAAAHIRRRGSS